jgi:hypothetical protein
MASSTRRGSPAGAPPCVCPGLPAARPAAIAGAGHGDAQSECEQVIGTLTRLSDQPYSRPTDVSKAFGEIARETLRGADYPASRDDLVQYAREQDADTAVIAALLEIPDEEYDSPDAVVIELVAV